MIKVILADPEKEIFNAEVKSVNIKTNDGEIGVFAGHEPLMSTISYGEVVIEKENENKIITREVFSAYNGVVNIENEKGKTKVIILVESVENIKDIDEKSLEEAIERAKIANSEKSNETFDLEIGMLRDMSRLKLARKYKV